MNIADRIQYLRKRKGISQEELADKIGVSRQAVSKWENGQSSPDIEKIILLSDFFNVTTDYLLKGITPITNPSKKKTDIKVFSALGTMLNFIGLVLSITIWKEYQTSLSVAIGFTIMAIGCTIFAIGQFTNKYNKKSFLIFFLINIWIISLIPTSCIFNCIQGISGGYWWTFTPIPQLANSIFAYIICWIVYFIICISIDCLILKHLKRI